jgi:hypothetical protein
MIKVRKANERGHFDFGWLKTYHTFSFGDYFDRDNMHFRLLRVINEDFVKPSQGFGTHGHRDMEIITYILRGGLEHKDSMGNGDVIYPGEVQRMSAGTGIMHSEFNHSKDEAVHLLQIWILPEKKGIEPSYEQTFFSDEEKKGKLRLIASPNGSDGSVTIHTDAKLFASLLEENETVTHQLQNERHAWIQVTRGAVEVNGVSLNQGDGAAVSDENEIKIIGKESSEILLFDLS